MNLQNSINARFRTIRDLKDVIDVSCALLEDIDSKRRYVVRRFDRNRLTNEIRLRFEQESRLLQGIECETYGTMHSYRWTEHELEVVYPFHQGSTLSNRLTDGPIDPLAVARLAEDLLKALRCVHGQGCVHRDFRPSHIVFVPSGRAILGGYGPLWRANLSALDGPLGVEMLRYASPELAGIIRHDIGPASDLYSVGLILYTALAGSPICDANSVSEILLQHSTKELETNQFPRETPVQLTEMILRLAQKDPRERYQSAAAACDDATAILEMIERGDEQTNVVIGRSDARAGLVDPAYVGRESQLRALQNQLQMAVDGGWKRVLIESPSGMGKSRLNQEVSRMASRFGCIVLHGDSTGHVSGEPNAPWMQVLKRIAAVCRTDDQLRDRLTELMANYVEEVITAMPPLAEVLGWKGSSLAGPHEHGQGPVS